MAGKKKGGKDAKKAAPEEPDETTEKLQKFYKKNCSELGAPYSKTMQDKFIEYEED